MVSIAAIQTGSSDNIGRNLSRIEGLLEQCCEKSCQVAVLPECFAYMQSNRRQLLENAEEYGTGAIQDWLACQSDRLGLYIIAGSVPLKTVDPSRVTNSLLAYNDNGECIKRYDKIFLFDVSLSDTEYYHESDFTLAGNEVSVIDSPAGKIGLSICYDLRFPEMYRELFAQGAEILVVPSAFSAITGKGHWRPLLQARAIENTCYVVAPAQFGTHNHKRQTWGHTLILDPWGKILDERASGWGVITADIDSKRLSEVRGCLPSLKHLRSDIFSSGF